MPHAESDSTRRIRRVLLAVAVLGGALALAIAIGGGFSFAVAGLPLRARRPWTLAWIAVAALLLAAGLGGREGLRRDLSGAWGIRDRIAPWVAGLAAAATVAVGMTWGTWSAGGADAYGYVSQALMWTRGEMRSAQPLALDAPWPLADWTMSPLGYRPAVTPGAIVPTYPPGLPLVMAAAAKLAGRPAAVFWIVPLSGAAVVWLAFLLGRWLRDAVTGAIAAVLVAASPVFLYQLVQPMSDVPVTAWWLGAIWLVTRRQPALSGVCAGAAVLTRPNLAPLAIWLAAGILVHTRHHASPLKSIGHSLLSFGIPLAAAVAFLGWTNNLWYGSPVASGYGSASYLFALANVTTNLARYPAWLWQTQTPLVFLGLLAPFAAWIGSRGVSQAQPTLSPVRVASAMGVVLIVFGSYLPYSPFVEWWYLRFLLPALPLLLALGGAVAVMAVERAPAPARWPVLIVGVVSLAALYVSTAKAGRVFDLASLEGRYAKAGRLVAARLPARAVLLSVQQSGSLRLYSGRTTLRYDLLDPAWLDRALEHLRAGGHEPYFALEAWEESQFRDRFSATSEVGRLDWPPAAEIGGPVVVRIYDPRDRARYLRGAHIDTITDRDDGLAGTAAVGPGAGVGPGRTPDDRVTPPSPVAPRTRRTTAG